MTDRASSKPRRSRRAIHGKPVRDWRSRAAPNVHPHIRRSIGRSGGACGLQANDVGTGHQRGADHVSLDLKEAISKRPGQQISMSIIRSGTPMTVVATPGVRDGAGFLGIDIADETVSFKPGLLGAARMSIERNVQVAAMIVRPSGA